MKIAHQRRSLTLTALLGLVAIVAAADIASADSVFSANGLGEWIHPTDTRGRGMGGTAIGIDDSTNQATINPALLANVDRFTLHADVTAELRRIEQVQDGRTQVSNPRSTNFPALRGSIAVPNFGTVGFGIAQYTDVTYEFSQEGEFEGARFEQTLTGKNGWSTFNLTYARTLRPELKLGVDINLMFGSYVDIWRVEFEDPDAVDSVDSLVVNHSRGPLVRFGVLYSPEERLTIGGSLTPPATLTLRPEIRSSTGERAQPEKDLKLPSMFGVGASYVVDKHWLLAADASWIRWSKTDLRTARQNVSSENVARYSIGAEYMANRRRNAKGLRERVALRAGYYQEPWHYRDPFGARITDRFVTAGVGIPFPRSTGFLQFSFEWGYRGTLEDNRARERVARIGIGLTLREHVVVGRVD